jgi:hypothetical protein
MNNSSTKNQLNPMLKSVMNFFAKMVKAQEEYPVKYYKRGKHYNKGRQLQ